MQTAIESVKTAADVYAPISGKVIEHNKTILTDPALVNSASESEGWLIKVKVQDDKDLSKWLISKDFR